ncbi:8-oxo-dGDP phosphatase nudt18 [Bulinus truncatus]|nr:8-oxo-dGDP phosphatase nudt18 [Bulinus truncatus]
MAFFETSLLKAVANGDVREMESFFKHKLDANFVFSGAASTDSLGKTLLEVAVENGHCGMVRMLLKHQSDPNLKMTVEVKGDSVSFTPCTRTDRLKMIVVYPCIVRNQPDMVRLLVDSGLDVNVQDDRGCTALWHAVDMDNYPMVEALISGPACDVNLRDVTGLGPLHVASMHSNVPIASLLIRHGGGTAIDARTAQGSTPLIFACRSAGNEMVRTLLLHGADPSHRNADGLSALHIAIKACHDFQILRMLLEAGAKVNVADAALCCVRENTARLDPQSARVDDDELTVLLASRASLKCLCARRVRAMLVRSGTNKNIDDKVKMILENVQTILRGDQVLIQNDLDVQPDAKSASFFPKTKANMCYICMTVLFNEQGQVLLIQEAKKGCRGQWYLPAGRLEPGETILAGAKREVLEEAGLDCELTTLIGVEINTAWMRHTDIIKLVELAGTYWEADMTARCPVTLPVIAPHKQLLHRVVIVDRSSSSNMHILANKKNGLHIPTALINQGPSIAFSVYSILKSAFATSLLTSVRMCGILGVEHRGTGKSEDGVCITSLVSIDLSEGVQPPAVSNQDFQWCPVQSVDLQKRLSEGAVGKIVPLLS